MSQISKSENGLTLIEVLVSIAIMFLIITAITQAIISSQFFTSYSRHKLQGMYAAQQILEQQRQKQFSASSSQTTAPVILDANGNFNGTAITTVTNLDAYRNRVSVEIDWPEQIQASKVIMKEYYSTIVANDPVPN